MPNCCTTSGERTTRAEDSPWTSISRFRKLSRLSITPLIMDSVSPTRTISAAVRICSDDEAMEKERKAYRFMATSMMTKLAAMATKNIVTFEFRLIIVYFPTAPRVKRLRPPDRPPRSIARI